MNEYRNFQLSSAADKSEIISKKKKKFESSESEIAIPFIPVSTLVAAINHPSN